MSHDVRPEIFTFLDYRRFLDAWFQWKKLENPRYSHRLFMRRAGQTSPSLLLQVIKGVRNLTPDSRTGFHVALDLGAEEREFFDLLVDFDQARDADERERAWQRISATRRFQQARHLEGESYRYLTHWYFVATRELAHRADFVDDPKWVSRVLRPKITVAQARDALETLKQLGLLVASDDGPTRPADGSVVTRHEVRALAARGYHAEMIRRALDAIDAFPSDARHLGAVTVSVPASLVPTLKEEITRFQERVLDLCDSVGGPREVVYQVNLQLFPLSAPLDSESS